MARYTGPKSKIARKFGDAILGPSKALAKKAILPANTGKVEEESNQNTQFS